VNKFSFFLLAVLAATALSAQEIKWSEEDYNYVSLEGDIILPMPCGGAMVFRRISTGSGDAMHDLEVQLGSPREYELSYLDFSRKEHISGPFLLPNDSRQYFLMGKYEVSRGQFDAVQAQDGCPEHDIDSGAFPISDITWFQAVEFTRRYTLWLLQNAPQALSSLGQGAFVRLPTEAEWEFAARGGENVSDSERRKSRYFSDNEIGEYAIYRSAGQGSDGLREIGSRKPNPLGLFDILGNVEEMIFEPFHLVHVGRVHGRAGGFVVRGGSFDTPGKDLTLSLRQEYGFFSSDLKEETKLKTIGMRVVISASALSGEVSSSEIADAWVKARRFRSADSSVDPVTRLNQVAVRTSNPVDQKALQQLAADISTELTERNALEDRLLQSLLENGGLIHRRIASIINSTDIAYKNLRILTNERIKTRNQKVIDDNHRELRLWANLLFNGIIRISDSYKRPQVEAELSTLANTLRGRGDTVLVGSVEKYGDLLFFYHDNRAAELIQVVSQITGPRDWFGEALR
jgi:hypothetical protein